MPAARERARMEGILEDPDNCLVNLFEAIKVTVHDAMLSRVRSSRDACGLELWRRLHTEANGTPPRSSRPKLTFS